MTTRGEKKNGFFFFRGRGSRKRRKEKKAHFLFFSSSFFLSLVHSFHRFKARGDDEGVLGREVRNGEREREKERQFSSSSSSSSSSTFSSSLLSRDLPLSSPLFFLPFPRLEINSTTPTARLQADVLAVPCGPRHAPPQGGQRQAGDRPRDEPLRRPAAV